MESFKEGEWVLYETEGRFIPVKITSTVVPGESYLIRIYSDNDYETSVASHEKLMYMEEPISPKIGDTVVEDCLTKYVVENISVNRCMKPDYQYMYTIKAESKSGRPSQIYYCSKKDIEPANFKSFLNDPSKSPAYILQDLITLQEDMRDISRKISKKIEELEVFEGDLTINQRKQFY